MTQTEAWEWVLEAAETIVRLHPNQDDDGVKMLRKAIPKVKPKVERMRARRAGTPKLPAWMKP